jgi:hypothetical protein
VEVAQYAAFQSQSCKPLFPPHGLHRLVPELYQC